MKRLAVYTSIDDKIYTKEIKIHNPDQHQYYVLATTQGKITLERHDLRLQGHEDWTQVWIEIGKTSLLNKIDIIEKAYQVFSKEVKRG